jgi:hypothetical protein
MWGKEQMFILVWLPSFYPSNQRLIFVYYVLKSYYHCQLDLLLKIRMSHGSHDSVLEAVKNKLLQTRAEADAAQSEVEKLRRLLIEEREKRQLVCHLGSGKSD